MKKITSQNQESDSPAYSVVPYPVKELAELSDETFCETEELSDDDLRAVVGGYAGGDGRPEGAGKIINILRSLGR